MIFCSTVIFFAARCISPAFSRIWEIPFPRLPKVNLEKCYLIKFIKLLVRTFEVLSRCWILHFSPCMLNTMVFCLSKRSQLCTAFIYAGVTVHWNTSQCNIRKVIGANHRAWLPKKGCTE